jgi:hypothetical protein
MYMEASAGIFRLSMQGLTMAALAVRAVTPH